MSRYTSAFALLAWALFWASVRPLVMATFFVSDRLHIPVPGDIVTFGAAHALAVFALPISLAFVFFAALDAAVIYIWGRIKARKATSLKSQSQSRNTL